MGLFDWLAIDINRLYHALNRLQERLRVFFVYSGGCMRKPKTLADSRFLPSMLTARPATPREITGDFCPAPEILEWLQKTIFNEDHPLYNPDHKHLHHLCWPSALTAENIGFLWAGVPTKRGNKRILGTCEKPMFKGAGWSRERQEAQMAGWFDGVVPDFLITLDACFCLDASDLDFCRLLEHELYHIEHAKDKYGELAYSRATGYPKIGLVSHDVEEFYKVVERYGADDAVSALIDAAGQRTASDGAIAVACGSTKLRLA